MSDLSNLKVGDEIIRFDGGGWGLPRINRSHIVAVTKAGNYKIGGDPDVWTKTGYKRGESGYHRSYFRPFDQAVWDSIASQHKEQRDRNRIARTDWKQLPVECVREIVSVLDKFTTAKASNE